MTSDYAPHLSNVFPTPSSGGVVRLAELGHRVLFEMQLVGLIFGRKITMLNIMKFCPRTSLSGAGEGLRIHHIEWKVWTETGFYSCLWVSWSHGSSQKRAHFIRLQGSGLWVSKKRRKYNYKMIKLYLDYYSLTRNFLFEMIPFASFCCRAAGWFQWNARTFKFRT